jgi:hypothetical protein
MTPERGLGYALGIVGGGCMLALLIYPARKRMRALSVLGSVKAWFRIHMILGVVGPILVLYHANFSFGATNSNIALVSMLIVAGSGLVGRYFYAKTHEGLYGHASTLAELQSRAARLRGVTSTTPLLAGLIVRIEAEERAMQSATDRHLLIMRPFLAAAYAYAARWRLRRFVHTHARAADAATRLRHVDMALQYMRTRIGSMRRVCEYQAYVALFSWWHILHLPLFFLLLLAGVAHVVAVHVY